MSKKEINIANNIYRHYEGSYWVTNCGKVAAINFDEDGDVKSFKKLKHQVSNIGYMRVELSSHSVKKKVSVHRLVYSVWGGELIEGMVIEHLDGDKSNNHISNLKQSTQSENIKTAFKHGTFHQAFHNKTNLVVFDKQTGITKGYEGIRDFLIDIEAPDYMIKHGGLDALLKRKDYKDRFVVERIGRKGRSSQTIENIT